MLVASDATSNGNGTALSIQRAQTAPRQLKSLADEPLLQRYKGRGTLSIGSSFTSSSYVTAPDDLMIEHGNKEQDTLFRSQVPLDVAENEFVLALDHVGAQFPKEF